MSRTLTPLGKWLRAFRIENDMLLKDMAEALGLSSAHLSGIETGRKPVPTRLREKVLQTFPLISQKRQSFGMALDQSVEDFKLRSVVPDRRDVAAVLARKFNDLPQEDIQEFRNLLSRRFNE